MSGSRSHRRRAVVPEAGSALREAPRLIIQSRPNRQTPALLPALRVLQRFFACYPRLTAGVIHTLIEEGKRFAATPEGAQLQRELSGAEWVEKGRILWEACGLDELLREHPAAGQMDQALSVGINSVLGELARADVEQLLSNLMFGGIPAIYDNSLRASSGIQSPQ